MNRVGELAAELAGALAAFGYAPDQAALDAADATAVLAAPRGANRTLCAVAALPTDLADPDDAAAFVGRLRKALSGRFRGLPKPRRLATYTVLLADHDVCHHLRAHTGRFIDVGRWHVNVLLGTVLVDIDEFSLRANTTWGLVDTGDQFEHIRRTVETWCGRYRKPRHSILAGTGRRHVA